jgi:soluble lytic murein transglycosylase-like protein
MMRLSHCLMLTAFAATVAAPVAPTAASAKTHSYKSISYRYRHAAPARPAAEIVNEVSSSQFYGPFGGNADAAASARYAGPNARRYFGGASDQPAEYASLVEQHASANGIPTSLVHRVIMRESRYNPRAVSAGNYGIMQIRLGTARAMGYQGSAAGLLDAQTNMTYAVRYLAGAYRAAHGNETLAVALYARGYNATPVQQ